MDAAESKDVVGLYDELAAACHASGWQVYRPDHGIVASVQDNSAPLFEQMSHAVEHADLCIVHVGSASPGVGAELTVAYESKRPLIAVRLSSERPSAWVESMLASYPLARVVTGDKPSDCALQVEHVLADPSFAHLVHEAAGEGLDRCV
jgi:nucleoside 2-deoxyribosyltransferase